MSDLGKNTKKNHSYEFSTSFNTIIKYLLWLSYYGRETWNNYICIGDIANFQCNFYLTFHSYKLLTYLVKAINCNIWLSHPLSYGNPIHLNIINIEREIDYGNIFYYYFKSFPISNMPTFSKWKRTRRILQ